MRAAVLIDTREGAVARPSLEALTLARTLGNPVAVWLGTAPADDAVAALAAHGAMEVRVAGMTEAEAAVPSGAAAAVVAATADCDVLVFVSTFANKEVAALAAFATGAGIVVDAAGAEVVDGKVETTQTVFTATWNVRTRITTDKAIVGIRPNSVLATEADTAGEARIVPVEFTAPQARETVTHREAVTVTGVPLAEAPVVVSGGRGTGGDYALVTELAELLGGAVGASRDATDEGWIGHEHMVGQTGTTVTPALYVACGISGAVHHRGGMQASGTIVTINSDPDAPIFEISDFGVVGDLFDVLPQVISKVRAHRNG